MKTVRMALSALAVGLLAASSLHAQEAAQPNTAAAPNQDVRCLIIGSALMQANDPAAKAAGPVLMFYYLGRIDAATPKLDLEKAFRDETPGTSADLANTAKACGDTFNARTKALGEMGSRLQVAPKPPAP